MEPKTDVKEKVDPSATNSTTEAVVKEATDKVEKEPSFEELTTDKKEIPYAVFKERNEKLRETERKLKTMEKDIEKKINEAVAKTSEQHRAYYEQQMMLLKQQQQQTINPYDYTDPAQKQAAEYQDYVKTLESKVSQLEGKFSHLDAGVKERELKTQITQLKQIYPMMEEEHVLALAKLKPEYDIEEIAQHSHNKFSEYTKNLYNTMIEQKKQAAKVKVSGVETRAPFKIENRPKTFKDARKMAAQLIRQAEEG
jgi:hypothetical protein